MCLGIGFPEDVHQTLFKEKVSNLEFPLEIGGRFTPVLHSRCFLFRPFVRRIGSAQQLLLLNHDNHLKGFL